MPGANMFRPGPTLTLANAKSVLEAGMRVIAAGETAIDMKDVVAVDSAAVATMLAWQRAAHRQGKSLAFHHLPTGLTGLANLYGVADLLQSAAFAA